MTATAAIDGAHFSSDGKWVVYQSQESGTFEVWVASFPAFDHRRQISTHGGGQAWWRSDGKEVFYWDPHGRLMTIPIRMGPALEADAPRDVFPIADTFTLGTLYYDVDAQGRFLLKLLDGPAASYPPSLLLNWPKLVKH